MKAVITDAVWQGHIPQLLRFVKTDWCLVPVANDSVKLTSEISDADAIIAMSLAPDVLAAARRLKLFQFPGAGAQHLKDTDVPAGCVLCNVFGHEVPIAEYVATIMLLHVTKLLRYSDTFRAGDWEGSGRLGGEPHGELLGKSLGLIGYGHIGQVLAVRARAFGMRVFAIRQHPGATAATAGSLAEWIGGPADLDRLLETADFVVVACPLSEVTRGMLGTEQFNRMKPSSVFINVARAEIADEEALFAVLRDRQIAGAALDAWYRYPASLHEAMHGSRLPFHELPNVIVTPHLSAWTHDMVTRRIQRVAENLDRLSLNEPLENVVLRGSWQPKTSV